jgi:protein-disulfide isomerase
VNSNETDATPQTTSTRPASPRSGGAAAAMPLAWIALGALIGFLGSEWVGFSRELPRLGARIAAMEVRMAMGAGRPAGAPPVAAPPPAAAEPRDVSTADAPRRGTENALVSIVEFSDFQCPFCSRAYPTIQQVLKEYSSDVALYFRHYPLPFHNDARLAHQAALAAGRQDRFWQMHDLIFENPRDLSREKLVEHAKALELDADRFAVDLDDPELTAKIDRDLADAEQLGVTGTPTFFINGHEIAGAQPYPAFKQLIDRELKAAKDKARPAS